MFKYKNARGGITEAMAGVQDMHSFQELEAYVHNRYGPGEVTVADRYRHDPRIGWDVYMVLLDGRGVGNTDSHVSNTE